MTKKRKTSTAEDPFAYLDDEVTPTQGPGRCDTHGSQVFSVKPGKPGVWPDEVPLLTAAQFARGCEADARGRRDLAGWLEAVFDAGHFKRTPCRDKAYTALLRLVQAKGRHTAVWEYNDDPEVSAEELAATWLELLRALDYEV